MGMMVAENPPQCTSVLFGRIGQRLYTPCLPAVAPSEAEERRWVAHGAPKRRQDGASFRTRFNASKEEKLWFIETRTGILTKRLPQRTTAELRFHSGVLHALLSFG